MRELNPHALRHPLSVVNDFPPMHLDWCRLVMYIHWRTEQIATQINFQVVWFRKAARYYLPIESLWHINTKRLYISFYSNGSQSVFPDQEQWYLETCSNANFHSPQCTNSEILRMGLSNLVQQAIQTHAHVWESLLQSLHLIFRCEEQECRKNHLPKMVPLVP